MMHDHEEERWYYTVINHSFDYFKTLEGGTTVRVLVLLDEVLTNPDVDSPPIVTVAMADSVARPSACCEIRSTRAIQWHHEHNRLAPNHVRWQRQQQ